MELADGTRRARSRSPYYGALAEYDTRLLTVAALNGAFQGRADQPVNYVNAPLIAAERGIEVREERSRSARDFTNLVRVELTPATSASASPARRSAATTASGSSTSLGFELELELAPLLVLFRYDDVPGVIGRVGTLLRRGRRQHREHDRLAEPAGRQGADGALGRLAAPASSSSASGRGLRRRDASSAPSRPCPSAVEAVASARRGPTASAAVPWSVDRAWPEPVERVAAFLARRRRRTRASRSSREGTPTAAAAATRGRLRARRRSSSRSSSSATARRRSRSSPATGAPTRARSPRPRAPRRARRAAGGGRSARPASSPAASRRSRCRGVSQVLIERDAARPRRSSGSAPAPTAHGRRSSPLELVAARARAPPICDVVRRLTRGNIGASHTEGSDCACARPRRSG